MLKSVLPVLLIAAAAASLTSAAERPAPFLPPDAFDMRLVLAPPPAQDSATTRAELAEVQRIQAKSTKAQRAQAVKDGAEEDVFVFATVLGPNFAPANLPLTAAFFDHVRRAEGEFVNPVKDLYKRPRPPVVDPAITPCEKLTGSPSYPSGHSTGGHLMAIVLADMVPEKRAAIFDRVEEYAHNRLVCGVHYPSDVEAGRIAGAVIAAMLMQNEQFKRDFAPARAELRHALALPPA